MKRQWIATCSLAGLLVSAMPSGVVSAASVESSPAAVCVPGPGSHAAQGGGTAASLHYLTDVRAAGHSCFDRVVFEFEPGPGEGALGYEVGYREGPVREEGRGRPVPVEGDATLVVRLSPARDVRLSEHSPQPTYRGPTTIRPPGARHVQEVRHVGSFEAAVTWAIGLDRERPFEATVMGSPARLVLDIP